MIIPPNLSPGDQVGLIATAKKVDSGGIEYATNLLNIWGLEVIEGPNLRNQLHLFAGSDNERASDLQWAINQPTIKAIICYRGGYGTMRMLEQVNLASLIQNPKWICGYSDVCVLHGALQQLGLASLHSTMPVNFESNSSSALESFKNALMGYPSNLIFDSTNENRIGKSRGQLIGGNLSILQTLSGTKYDLDYRDKILVIEDLDEYLYHIDRMMQSLKAGNKLDQLRGLVVGEMTDLKDNETPFGMTIREIIHDAIKDYDFPVAFNAPIGHFSDNHTIALGQEYSLSVDLNSTSLQPLKN